MTVVTPPAFLQAGAHPAETVRLMTAGLFGSTAASFPGGVGAIDPGHGIVRPGHLAVTQNGTPNMSVDVAVGGAFIRGTAAADQGCYHFYNDATLNLTVGTSDPTNGRRDLVVAQVRDSSYAGSDNDARLFIVQGTAAAVPADPAIPANCLVLARLTVAANATSIVTADIEDHRRLVRPWNTAWGVLGSASVTSTQTLSTTSYVDLTNLSATAVFLVGRRYRLRGYVPAIQTTATGFVADAAIVDSTNTFIVQQARQDVRTAGDEWTLAPSYDFVQSGSDAAITWKLRGRCSVSSTEWRVNAGANSPAQFAIEDMGPA